MKNELIEFSSLKDNKLFYESKVPKFGYYFIIFTLLIILSLLFWSIKANKNYIVNGYGNIVNNNKNYVMTEYAGEIISINIYEGKIISEGDELFVIKSTDIDLQIDQLNHQKTIYEDEIINYQKLIKSITDNINYFDINNSEESLFYSQFESYRNQIEQKKIDTNFLLLHGYSTNDIENELNRNQSEISEIYYTTINTVESSLHQSKIQLDNINSQLEALNNGKNEYVVYSNTNGKVHMLYDIKKGMVLNAGTAVASISTENEKYDVIAYIAAKDVSKISIDDEAEIAITGLNSLLYGTIKGKITNIDCDISNDTETNKTDLSSYYKVYIQPEISYLVGRNGDIISLSNGIPVDIKIIYNKETYLDYFINKILFN